MKWMSLAAGTLRHLRFGPTVVFEYLTNRLRLWESPRQQKLGLHTSISDSDRYNSIVVAAIKNDEVFRNFRSNSDYTAILEHVSYSLGLKYLNLIEKYFTDEEIAAFESFEEFHEIGHPAVYTFKIRERKIRMSPTFLRYAKVSLDLKMLFGNLNNISLAEIGIGFGGQAAVLQRLNSPRNSKLFDLPNVLLLAEKFLAHSGTSGEYEFLDERPMTTEADLVISNYAFSELSRGVQELYLISILSKSTKGYVTWNTLSERNLGGLSCSEFMARIPGSQKFAEVPLSHPGNCIIVWGHFDGSTPILNP